MANNVSASVGYNSTSNPISLSITGGTPTSVAVSTQAGHGTATASGTSISYTPTSGFSGSDSFQYTATNAGGTSAPATVSIGVAGAPPPIVHVSPTPSWANISHQDPSTPSVSSNSAQQIQGITGAITLQFNTTTTAHMIYHYSKNGGAWTVVTNGGTISVSPNDTLSFEATLIQSGSSSGTITILNESDGNTQIGSFSYSLTAGTA